MQTFIVVGEVLYNNLAILLGLTTFRHFELGYWPSVNEANLCTCCSQVNIVNQQSGLTGPYLDITAEGQQVRVHLPSFLLSSFPS